MKVSKSVSDRAVGGSAAVRLIARVILIVSLILSQVTTAFSEETIRALNNSAQTICAEEDNVRIMLYGTPTTFFIEATHPSYVVASDNCAADFTNCGQSTDPSFPVSNPGTFKIYDDGVTVVDAVREPTWWRPTGMAVQVNAGSSLSNIHYMRIYRKIADEASWPQVLVLYADGNLRLIPHPPRGASSVCFGSSVIVGPVARDPRPIAEISAVDFNVSAQTLTVTYTAGGSARIVVDEVNRTRTKATVIVDYPTNGVPFAAFMSMYVAAGNADVNSVEWHDLSGTLHDDPIMPFTVAETADLFFRRQTLSQHNTSAPDIRIRLQESRCEAVLSSDLSLHIPVVMFDGLRLWANFRHVPETLDIELKSAGPLNDTTSFGGCEPSVLSGDLQLHVPSLQFYGDSYWAEFQYHEGLRVTLTDAGQR